jgi:hypothetical protein
MSGTSAPDPTAGEDTTASGGNDELYPPLRQLPRLAVPYADLYRRVRVQEAVYELLTQQYEIARLQEAKDVPVVSVIDTPGIPEKKSFPPRLLVSLLFTLFAVGATAGFVLFRQRWESVDESDPRKVLARDMEAAFRKILRRSGTRRGVL